MPRLLIYLLVQPFLISAAKAQPSEKGIVFAATRFLDQLSPEQRNKVNHPFISEERFNFHFVPRNDRKGIALGALDEKQKAAAMNLLRACLSTEAYRKAGEIIQLELVLKAIEKRPAGDHYRDPDKYFISLFGTPGTSTTWGWRFEGHHISFNFSTVDNKLVAGTPGFLGANPAIVPDGPQKGKQVLREETALGYTLLRTFTKEQYPSVLMDSTAPGDIFTFNKRKAAFEKPAGIRYSEMTAPQQELLYRLVALYVHRYTKLFADDMMAEITKAGLQELRFAWAGSSQPGIGQLHYYRIQGPTLIIEYDNTQNNGNHVHSVVRDLLHDFGGDELLEHYQAAH